jgi:phage terminase large subunit-like protein
MAMSKPQATQGGATVIEPYTEQKPFLKQDKRYFGFVSGVGAGKTFCGIIRTIRNMVEWNPGEMGAIVAPTRQMIVNVIIPEMRELGLFDAPINWEFNSSHSSEPGIETPEGSRALLLSADNSKTIERLRGLNLAWVWIDERTAVPDRAKEILMQRLRAGSYRNLYETTTPAGYDPTYDFYVGDVDAEKSQHGRASVYETEDRRAVVGVPTDANPHTPEDYKEAMEQDMPEEVRAQEVQGEFVEIGQGVFTRDMFQFVAPGHERVDREVNWQTIIGVDPAATIDEVVAEDRDSDYWGVCVAQVNPVNKDVFITDTARKRGMGLNQAVEWVSQIQASAGANSKVFIESNQAQVYLMDALRDAGVNASPVKTSQNKEDKLIDLTIPLGNGVFEFVDWNTDKPLGDGHPYGELVDEALMFPEGNHDDLLDALYLAVSNSGVSWGSSIVGGDAYGDDEDSEGESWRSARR